MRLLRKRNLDGRNGIADSFANHRADAELQEQAQEVMKDNLEMMRDVVMRIREDPDFAKGIYKDCPRFQHLLRQYPDLRPVFEDPKLVKINFESVYRQAGGILPEDEVKKKSWLVWFVQSPIFKVLKLLLLVKKLFACIAGGGVAFIVAYVTGCCFEDPPMDDIDGAEDMDIGGGDATKEALNRAAEHMEDPDVQEQMQLLLEDPDNMEEVISNDEELRLLQQSNPLCEELMTDPETMKVLTDPDNLRALGECTDLIEADFMDPGGFTPEALETGGMDGYGDGLEVDVGEADLADTYGEFEIDVDGDDQDGFDSQDQEESNDYEEEKEGEEEEDVFADGELEAQEQDTQQGEKGGKKSKSRTQQNAAANRGNGGVMASIGAAATDLVAGAVISSIFGDTLDLGGGGGDDLDAAGGLADAGGDLGDGLGDGVADAGDAAEGAADGVDDKKDAKKGGGAATAGAAAGGAIMGGGLAAVALNRNGGQQGDEEEEVRKDGFGEEDSKPKKRIIAAFKKVKNAAAYISTTAKEHVATSLLGDDWGEALVESKEEGNQDKKEENEDEFEEEKKEDKSEEKR